MRKNKVVFGLIVLGFIAGLMIGKELYHNRVFLGLVYKEPSGTVVNTSQFLTQEETDKMVQILQSEKDAPINWEFDIKTEIGENDKTAYIKHQKYEGNKIGQNSVPILDECNDAYKEAFIEKRTNEPDIQHILELTMNECYCYDVKMNKNSCSWQYKGNYLGCDFRAEYVYVFDDNDVLTSKLQNVKWSFRNKFIKVKKVSTNLDYDFEKQLEDIKE